MVVAYILFVYFMNESGWCVLRVVLFLQMITTLPLRLRHQNYPRRCTYEVFPKWQRLKGKKWEAILKAIKVFKPDLISDTNSFVYFCNLSSTLNTRVGQTNRAVQTVGLSVCISFACVSDFLLAGCSNKFICAKVLTFFQMKKAWCSIP